MPPAYGGFQPLIPATRVPAQPRPTPSTRGPAASRKNPEVAASDGAGDTYARDATPALRSTFVDAEEAAMRRALARISGDDASRKLGNSFSQTNRARTQQRLDRKAAIGLVPLDPKEQHDLQRAKDAGYTTISQRGVNVPRVGVRAAPQMPPMVDFVPHRRTGEEIREANDNFEPPALPAYRPTRSGDERKDELATRQQFYGKTPQEILAEQPAARAPPRAPAPSLRNQIEDEIAERHDFLDAMQKLGQGREHEARIKGEVAERMQDLRRLEKLGE